MRRLRVPLLLLLATFASAAARAGDDEAALRRRVERFYVLSYLDRHGEMWEIFAPSLQHQLGDDRGAYARSARGSGFELFASRIDAVNVRGASATVDVAIQVQLPGTTDVQWRRHRMAWQLDPDRGWLYAGSLDVTHEQHDVGDAPLEAQPVGGVHEESPDELLPLREPMAEPSKSTVTSPPREGNERWDLVAIPPPDRAAPAATAPIPATPQAPAATPPRGEAAPRAEAAAPPVREAAEQVARLEPPERAAPESLPKPPPALPPRRHETARVAEPELIDDAPEALNTLVRRAALASGLVRVRAIEKLRKVADPVAADLMVSMIDQAGPDSAVFFLERIAVLGRSEHAKVAHTRLDAPEGFVRAAAARVLGELGGPQDVPLLASMLRAELETSVRVEVLRALGLLGGDPAVVEVLADEQRGDAERAVAARAVAASPSPAAEPAVLEILRRRSPRATFLATIDAAGRLATPASIEALDRLVESGGTVDLDLLSSSVRLAALRALVRAEAPRAGERLSLEMMAIGMDAAPGDVDLVAESGDAEALLSLLAHLSAPVRRRAAELSARVIQAPDAAARAAARLDEALPGENDNDVLLAIHAARERLRAAAQGLGASAGAPERR
jgi:hypothetical protein